jgi:hypothetical protein
MLQDRQLHFAFLHPTKPFSWVATMMMLCSSVQAEGMAQKMGIS